MSKKKAKRPDLKLVVDNQGPQVANVGLAMTINVPNDEKVIVKEVDAKVDGTVVGKAQIYEDGTVGVILDDDAPEELVEKIRGTADQFGYSIGTED